jgi:hypothetical protein
MPKETDFLVVVFAFILGSILGYMAGTPHDCKPVRPAYEATTIQDVLPTMGQE